MHRFLFVKESLAWPRSAGHDVHAYHMMRALADLGHEVALLSVTPVQDEAIAGLPLVRRSTFNEVVTDNSLSIHLTRLQDRFRSYWGIDMKRVDAVARVTERLAADVVVVVGLEVLPYLAGVRQATRVWYAADEWAWHHLSQFRPWRRSSWSNASQAGVKGLYERAYGSVVDRIWVVSKPDARAMRLVSGVRAIDVVPNGVDSEHYSPREVREIPKSCVFWGRLDFGPNIDALTWFAQRVWPTLVSRHPTARLSVFGFQPSSEVQVLASAPGIELVADQNDIREDICRRELVVLPFVSGGGIKNKLLEAASLGRAIVASPRAMGGLDLPDTPPFMTCRPPGEWIQTIERLWGDATERARLGRIAREWVIGRHSWRSAAQIVLRSLQ